VGLLVPFFKLPLFCSALVPMAKAELVPQPLAFSCFTASSRIAGITLFLLSGDDASQAFVAL
jgi:hypothetical protein